jgi:GNAT superfamily N-acetyltransferase
MSEITFRPGTPEDAYTTFLLFEETFADLSVRLGFGEDIWTDPDELAATWQERRPLYEYLSTHTDYFVVAEQNGRAVGFARSIRHDDVRELTEFFVLPSVQSAGVGRELLARAFPNDAPYRCIIATTDLRAQGRYLRSGVYPRFPIYYFAGTPQPTAVPTDLTIAPLTADSETAVALAKIDQVVWGFRRGQQHDLLQTIRQGVGYWRNGRLVGYGYLNTGNGNGPFALLDAADYPAVLAHAESDAAAQGHPHFGLEMPLCNETAVQYLLQRGFQMEPFLAFFMCNRPFGRLENSIITSPPFFL